VTEKDATRYKIKNLRIEQNFLYFVRVTNFNLSSNKFRNLYLFRNTPNCSASGFCFMRVRHVYGPRHSSGGYSPASHRGGPGSNPSLVMWDFVMDKSGAGAGFLWELRFPLPIYIPYGSPQSSSLSPEADTIGQEWPQCQQPHKPNNNNK
jgi:hypothetical protein